MSKNAKEKTRMFAHDELHVLTHDTVQYNTLILKNSLSYSETNYGSGIQKEFKLLQV